MAKRPTSTTRRAAQRAAPAAAPDLTPRSAFALTDEEIERALVTGEYRGELEDYFGAAQYDELRRLKQEASTRAVRGGDRVLILPGIMGSKLGRKRPGLLPDDIIWANPIDLALGKVSELALPQAGKPVKSLGVILLAYLTLKLRLQLAGFDADFWHYDWRQTVPSLGKLLAADIQAQRAERPSKPIYLVAHSMGGLVSRASLPHLDKAQAPDRIVMLGTPNYGSFAPVQAFRGASGTAKKLAALDQQHDLDGLTKVFGTFPGLMEMIPSPRFAKRDFFDLNIWPKDLKHPAEAMLLKAKKAQETLPIDHEAYRPTMEAGQPVYKKTIVMICGVNRDTVVNARVVDGRLPDTTQFAYDSSDDGDGTVPLDCALIASAKETYYVEEEHGALPGNGRIQSALPSILTTGKTSELATSYTRSLKPLRTVTEEELDTRAPPPTRGLPSVREQRLLLAEFAAPQDIVGGLAPLTAAVAATAAQAAAAPGRPLFAQRVTVGRGRQQRLDITLAHGSITEADASCYVVGLFQNVAPDGAASAIDNEMNGALTNLLGRRMFGADVGEISILPRGRHGLRSESVAFAGLGAFDQFNESSLEIVGENLIRTFAAARVDDFAVVPFGGATGRMTASALQYLMVGFLRGLKDADPDRRFRGITICETNEERYAAIRSELFQLSATTLFDDVEVEFQECVLPPPRARAPTREARPTSSKVYLIVRQDNDREDREGFLASVLTSGSSAAIESGRKTVQQNGQNLLDDHLGQLGAVSSMNRQQLGDFGRGLGEIVLEDNVREVLRRFPDDHLVVVHDAAASRIPWETLALGARGSETFPAGGAGLSHRYEAANFSVAKWRHSRQLNEVLDVLMIVNPTADLDGASKESAKVRKILDELRPAVRYRWMEKEQARKSEILRCLTSGEFDVVHYAGHAFFDRQVRGNSGLLCAGREVLSGADLANAADLPTLMFFNACESARVRKMDGDLQPEREREVVRRHLAPDHIQQNLSFAEALLRGGVANFLGTYWPVGDDSAAVFAETFYSAVLAGQTLNAALQAGRTKVKDMGSPDWADYVFYGDPDFQVKIRRNEPSGGGGPIGG